MSRPHCLHHLGGNKKNSAADDGANDHCSGVRKPQVTHEFRAELAVVCWFVHTFISAPARFCPGAHSPNHARVRLPRSLGNVSPKIDTDRFPEWQPFVDALQQRRPDAGTWCEAWTVRDIVIHQAGNAKELARVLGAHLAGEPVATRGFEEREAPLRAINETDLWTAKGVKQLRPGERIEARLRVADADDVVLDAEADRTTIALAEPDGPATLETDAAARVLLLWGRRPADPSRICSRVGAETLGRVRSLLAGY